jgi:hypothetical protein
MGHTRGGGGEEDSGSEGWSVGSPEKKQPKTRARRLVDLAVYGAASQHVAAVHTLVAHSLFTEVVHAIAWTATFAATTAATACCATHETCTGFVDYMVHVGH